MNDPGPVVWSDDFLTGVPPIDAQHQVLVSTLNEADARLAGGVSQELLDRVTRELLSYALYHFETEEGLMRERGYADLAPEEARRHREEHRAFSRRVVAIREGLRDGNLVSREELVGFLKSWLVDHILNTDRRLAAWLTERGPGTGGEGA